ncbi:MAG: asparagine synthase (glutamine-hydrolyzing) [Bacteroidetes bacterium]|nr:asparagine synthase (glutamine-hydrolyzing) [Bacteroidota bacterium]
MCGISGIIKKNNTPVQVAEITAMNNLVAHRGPDGEGFYYGPGFAFGHRRLSIIDLSENGHQPMEYNDKLVITFNGEIYNYLEIRNELKEKGYDFRSESDTEVILAAYQCWGEDCVKHFNGMWAMAVYDKITETIFCSRDRFGVKPFYYTVSENAFVFGSEIKQVLPFAGKITYDQKVVLDYLIIGFEDHSSQTFFRNVFKLMPSHNLVYNLRNHEFVIKPYYEIEFNQATGSLNEAEAIETYRHMLESAVQLRLRSDVKVGTCLSGGMDSSSVAAIAAKQYTQNAGQQFTAIHAQATELNIDESDKAKIVSDHCHLNLEIIKPSETDFLNVLDEVIYTQEEPFGSPSVFMQYFVLKKARELNCLVMLDGQGGDETLLGYEKYYPAYLASLKGIRNKWSGFMKSAENSSLSRMQVLKYFVYFTKYRVRIRHVKKRCHFLKREILNSYESAELKQLSEAYLDIQKMQLLEIKNLQLPHLLRYEDKNSMRNSVETRLPFLDYRVLQTALSVNNGYKIKNGWTKYILRKSMEKLLPESIVWRRNKLGFNAPEKTWLDSISVQMKAEIETSPIIDTLVDRSVFQLDQLDLRTKWRMFNLARWQKLYNVQAN